MMIRIQATRRGNEFILWTRYPVTAETEQEAKEDGISAYYCSPFKQDPTYKDWRIETCEYDLIDDEPQNIRVIKTEPIVE